ncbi:MAG: folate-binding protein YgfZ [Betaproteobacteria bacterium]|nr:folate-binding protein YgfZ [Betaproteobacteria bacterium]
MSTRILCELAPYGLIRFSGEEAETFLHNQLSCDVAALAPGRSTYGSYCTPKGRMLATFLLWRSQDDFFMQLPASLREPVQKKLSTFILRAKVKAVDASNDWAGFGIAGGDAVSLVRQVFGQAPQTAHEAANADGATIIRLPVNRLEIVVAKNQAPAILESLSGGAEKAKPDYWSWLDIRAGVPVIQPATQEEFVPQMVNLDAIGGLSLTKGCYPGQEIVARMHYRGTLKQRMYLVNVAATENPQPGDRLYSAAFGEQACGTVVNAARSPEGGYDALAVMQIASAGRGEVRWKSLEGPALKLLPLPYTIAAVEAAP